MEIKEKVRKVGRYLIKNPSSKRVEVIIQ